VRLLDGRIYRKEDETVAVTCDFVLEFLTELSCQDERAFGNLMAELQVRRLARTALGSTSSKPSEPSNL
jgi:hypothetical protein